MQRHQMPDPAIRAKATFIRLARKATPPWHDLEDFVADVGLPTEATPHLYRLNPDLPMGKGNAAWRKAQGKPGTLTDEQVLRVRYNRALSNADLGAIYGITASMVSAIKRKVTYPHVNLPPGIVVVHAAEDRGEPRFVPAAEVEAWKAKRPEPRPPAPGEGETWRYATDDEIPDLDPADYSGK